MDYDKYQCSCGKIIRHSSHSNHLQTTYHKKITELKNDNDNLLTRLVEERVRLVNLQIEFDNLKKKYDKEFLFYEDN